MSTAERTLRLFVAIDPPETVRKDLAALPRDVDGARWVRAGQLHVTLRFLGDVAAGAVDRLAAALGGVASTAFSLHASGFGVFPPRGAPRVLWAGLSPAEPLRALAAAVNAALAATGLTPPADKPFSPHLTLARLERARPGDVKAWIDARGGFSTVPWAVEAFTLYASRLLPSGAVHTPLARHALASAKGDAS